MQSAGYLLLSVPLCASFGAPEVHPTVVNVETGYVAENVAETQATPEEMQAGLQIPGVIEFANPNKHYWSCVDGRSTEPVFGTAGGDAGEFVAALSAVLPYASEEQKNKPIGELTSELFLKYLDTEITEDRPFYLHTDEESVDKAKEKLKCKDDSCVLFFPNPDDEKEVAEMQSDPAYMGCGHLKYMIEQPDLYHTDPAMVISMIQSFFRYAWEQPDNSKVHFHIHDHKDEHSEGTEHPEGFYQGPDPFGAQVNEVSGKVLVASLPGPHEEQAILVVNSENEKISPDEECSAPMVRPSFIDEAGEYTQYFVAHSLSGTITGLRRKNVQFFMRELGVNSEDEDEVLEDLEEWYAESIIADEYLAAKERGDDVEDYEQYLKDATTDLGTEDLLATVSILAAELPLISADVSSEGGALPRC